MIGVGIYVKNSPRAIALYQAAFGLELGYHVLNSDGTYFHSELHRGGEPFCSVVEARQDTYAQRHPVELGVDFRTRTELERAFQLLADGGRVEMDICELPWSPCAAIVIDPFGVRWFLSLPQHKPAEGWSPEEESSSAKEEMNMELFNQISLSLQAGKAKDVKNLVQQAIDEGVSAQDILEKGLLAGMSVVGEKFKNNEIFVPEVLVAARAMNRGADLLKPLLKQEGVENLGRVCIGTVQGDLHDIGKNLVKMMMEGKGLEVIDLGTDVAPETFVNTAIEKDCRIICCSALLTTTMSVMGDVVKLAQEKGIRDKVKIMIGGAPVSQSFCDAIGADAYTTDAATAADCAVALCKG